jgi:hypothetical protein
MEIGDETAAKRGDAVVVRDLTARGVRVRFSEAGQGSPVFVRCSRSSFA